MFYRQFPEAYPSSIPALPEDTPGMVSAAVPLQLAGTPFQARYDLNGGIGEYNTAGTAPHVRKRPYDDGVEI